MRLTQKYYLFLLKGSNEKKNFLDENEMQDDETILLFYFIHGEQLF